MAESKQVGPGLHVKFGIDMSELIGAGGQAAIVLNQSLDLFSKFERAGQMAFDNTVGKAIAYQEVIEDLHNTLGITNTDAQKWKSTLVSFDTDMGAFSTTLRYLTQRVSDTGASGESLRATLKGIGVDAKDASGNYKNASDLMQEILVSLDKMPEGARKANLEVEIYGRNWYQIANLVNNGTLAVQKFKEQQPLFSDEELERIDKAKVKMGEFNQKVDAIGAKTGAWVLENHGISSLLDYLSGSGQYAEDEARWKAYQKSQSEGYSGDYNSWFARQPGSRSSGLDYSGRVTGSYGGAALTIPALLTGPETLQLKLDEITNTTLPKLKQAYLDAIPTGNIEQINSARKAYNDVLQQQIDIKNQIRDQNLTYQQIIDISLPRLKENLEKAKGTGLKTDIEAAQIALDQGVNSANDLGTALGKAAISADSIKASITPAAGWSYKDVVGTAGSEMYNFMIDEMNHGATRDEARAAWAAGAHSYNINGTYAEGTLGAAANAGTVASTRNPGRNEREAMAAAGSDATSTTSTSSDSPLALETKAQKTELDKQLKTVETHLVDVHKAYLEGYLKIEKLDREHWTFLTEEMKTSLGNLTDNHVKFVKYVADNPTIMNIGIVTWTKAGADWDPTHNADFMQTVRMSAMISSVPEYKSVDLSKIEFAGASQKTEGNKTIQITQTFNGNTDPQAVKDATKDAASEALAEDAIARGWN